MAHPYWHQEPTLALRRRPRWYWFTLAAIFLLGLALRAVGVGRYPGLIYDEYYYVPAADVLLWRHPLAAVKNMIPGIDPNLLSHPPLAKELIALAIFVFGQHPWAWRLSGVLWGALVPLIVAGITWELFQSRITSLIAAGLAAVDGLSLVVSRVALPDAPAVTFALAAMWVLLAITGRLRRGERVGGWRWTALGFSLGLSLAAEWIGGQAILLCWIWLAVSHPRVRQAYRRWIPITTLVPFAIYYASYFYAWPSGYHQAWLPANPFIAFFKLQLLMLKDMWSLRFFHPWTSNAWTWLLIPRPTAMILSVNARQAVRVMAFPDPVVVWAGLVSLVAGMWLAYRHPRFRLAWAFLALWLLCFYGTWLAAPRSKFLYYFTTASIGLDIAVAAGIVILWHFIRERWRWRIVVGVVAGFMMLTVAYCVPLWVGMAVPPSLYQSIWWPKSWSPRVRRPASPASPSFSLTMHPVKRAVKPWSSFPVPAHLQPMTRAWTESRGTANHNSVYSGGFTISHGYSLTLASSGLEQAPSVVGSAAYVGTNNNQVYAVNLTTGAIEWGVAVPNMVMTTPLVSGGLVVVGIGNSAFRRYSNARGWIRGAGVNGVMAFDAATGAQVWYYPTVGEDMATPLIYGGEVLEVTGSGRLIAVSLSTGKLLWSKTLRGFDSFSSPILVGSNLYVATNSYYSAYPATRSTVWDINLDTRRVVWSTHLKVASGLSDCSLASDGSRLFVAGVTQLANGGKGPAAHERLFALGRYNGVTLWSRSLGKGNIANLDQPEVATPMVHGGVVYEGSPASNRMMAFAASTGHLDWSRRLPTGVIANPVMMGQHLLVAGIDGRIFELNADSGRLTARDPYRFGAIGLATPLIVSNALIEDTMTGKLVVQRLGPQ